MRGVAPSIFILVGTVSIGYAYDFYKKFIIYKKCLESKDGYCYITGLLHTNKPITSKYHGPAVYNLTKYYSYNCVLVYPTKHQDFDIPLNVWKWQSVCERKTVATPLYINSYKINNLIDNNDNEFELRSISKKCKTEFMSGPLSKISYNFIPNNQCKITVAGKKTENGFSDDSYLSQKDVPDLIDDYKYKTFYFSLFGATLIPFGFYLWIN